MSISKETELMIEQHKLYETVLYNTKADKFTKCKMEQFRTTIFPACIITGLFSVIGLKNRILPRVKGGLYRQFLASMLTTYLALEITSNRMCLFKTEIDDEEAEMIVNETQQLIASKNKLYSDQVTSDVQDDNDNLAWGKEELYTDLDKEFVNNIDSTYSDKSTEDLIKKNSIKDYVTYNELRKENRQKYKNQIFSPSVNAQTPNSRSDLFRKYQTKYGDVLDE